MAPVAQAVNSPANFAQVAPGLKNLNSTVPFSVMLVIFHSLAGVVEQILCHGCCGHWVRGATPARLAKWPFFPPESIIRCRIKYLMLSSAS